MDTAKKHKALAGREANKIRQMFGEISPRYDLLNHMLSGFQDIRWRNFAASRIPREAKTILDVCTGTGDIPIKVAARNFGSRITGVDFSSEMMERAKKKIGAGNLSQRIGFVQADATALPFPDKSFDAATVAFGLRNVADRLNALIEMKRVIKPLGKLIVLEMTLPKRGLSNKFYGFYLKRVIPFVGGLVSGKKKAYDYLTASIEKFLTPEELTDLFHKAGISEVKEFPLTFGITYLHEGIV